VIRVDNVCDRDGSSEGTEDLTGHLGLLGGGSVERLEPGRERCEPGRGQGELEAVGGENVSPALVLGYGVVHRPVPGQAVVDGLGQQFGGQEGVRHAHAGRGVFVVTGVVG